MIDAIQRLGLEYYFEDEIHVVLAKHHESYFTVEDDSSLHDLALRFRLLRQYGYNVPPNMFDKFMDKNGKFDPKLGKDTKGLMNLFEASHLSVPGEHILEEAFEFSQHWLQILIDVEQATAGMIRNTLTCPFYKSLPRFMAENNLRDFESSLKALHDIKIHSNKWISEIQELARIDISMAKLSYQTEITHVSRWWKELRLTEELEHARSEPAKRHLWSLACLPGPDMGDHRVELTKALSFLYFIDDIFDVYGTVEELTLFTEAVNKWEYENVEGLPEYMKISLKALYDTTDEMSNKIYNKHGGRPKELLQKVWAELCNAFLVEAKWFNSGQMPKCEDYLHIRISSSGVSIFCACFFLFFGEEKNCGNKFTIVDGFPKIVSLAATIFRLWNDFGGSKDKNESGHDGSFIACYMNEHDGCSTENARKYVYTMIEDAWKQLNEICLSPSPYSRAYKTTVLNLARMTPVMYNYEDNHSIEKHMSTLLMTHERGN